MTDFKIRRGLSTDLFINGDNKAGVIESVVLENGCWYLCTDTADLFLCVQQTNGLTLKRINEKAGWDITIDGDTIDASVIIALRAEVDNIKESLNDYAKTSDIPSLEGYATKEFVVDAIDKHEALATIEEVKTKLETEVLPTVQETILPTVQKVEIEILPTVQELAEKAATQEWVQAQNFANETFVEEKISEIEMPEVPTKVSELENDTGYITLTEVPETDLSNYYNKAETETLVTDVVSGKADKDHAHDTYADKDHLHEQYLTEHQSLDHKADKIHTHEEYLTEHQDLSHLAAKEHAHEEYALADHEHDEYLTEHQDISGKADIDHVHDNYAAKDHEHDQYLTEHQSLADYAKKSDLPDISTKADKVHSHAEYLTEHQDISGKADIDHKHDDLYEAKGTVAALKNELLNGAGEAFDTLKELGDLISGNVDAIEALKTVAAGKADKEHTHTEYAVSKHTHDQYLTEQNLSGYATEEFVTQAITAINIPSIDGLASEQFVTDKIAEITIPSTDGFVTEDYVTEKIAEIKIPDVTNFVTKDEVPSIEGLATEDFVKEEINKIVIPEAADFSNYYNKEEIDTKFENIEHPTVSFDGYATETYVDEAIKNVTVDTSGLATIEQLADKADAIPFTTTNLVTKPMGSFVIGDDVAGLTIAQILAKLLGLDGGSGENPDEPDVPSEPELPDWVPETTPENVKDIIRTEQTPYILNGTGELVTEASTTETFCIKMTPEESYADSTETCFYQIIDEDTGELLESGYQIATVEDEVEYMTVALPSSITKFHVEQYNPFSSKEDKWEKVSYQLIPSASYSIEGYTVYTATNDTDGGPVIRIVIEEEI